MTLENPQPSPAPAEAPPGIAEPAASREEIRKSFENLFAQKEENIDNSSESDASQPLPQPEPEFQEDKPPEIAEKPGKEGEGDPAAEQKPEEGEAVEAEPEASDFDAIEKPKVYPDAEALKAKYPRNANKELLAEAAEYAAEAKIGSEVIEKIGGQPFVEPMAKIAAGARAGDVAMIFDGLSDAGSEDLAAAVIANSLYLGLVQSQQFQEDPEMQKFGASLAKYTDTVLTQRFGNDAEALGELVKLKDDGWIDFFKKAIETGDLDDLDEKAFDELMKGGKSPEFKSLTEKVKTLEEQLEKKKTQDKSGESVKKQELDNSFQTLKQDSVGNILKTVVWQRSPLREIETDSPELKADKTLFRGILEAEAVKAFNLEVTVGDKKYNLREMYRRGEEHTATFQTVLAQAVDNAVLATKERDSQLSSVIARLYGKTRDGSLPKIQPPAAPPNPANPASPTQPQEFAPAAKKTRESIAQEMTEQIAAL